MTDNSEKGLVSTDGPESAANVRKKTPGEKNARFNL